MHVILVFFSLTSTPILFYILLRGRIWSSLKVSKYMYSNSLLLTRKIHFSLNKSDQVCITSVNMKLGKYQILEIKCLKGYSLGYTCKNLPPILTFSIVNNRFIQENIHLITYLLTGKINCQNDFFVMIHTKIWLFNIS